MPEIIESGNGTVLPRVNNIDVSRRKFPGYGAAVAILAKGVSGRTLFYYYQ